MKLRSAPLHAETYSVSVVHVYCTSIWFWRRTASHGRTFSTYIPVYLYLHTRIRTENNITPELPHLREESVSRSALPRSIYIRTCIKRHSVLNDQLSFSPKGGVYIQGLLYRAIYDTHTHTHTHTDLHTLGIHRPAAWYKPTVWQCHPTPSKQTQTHIHTYTLHTYTHQIHHSIH